MTIIGDRFTPIAIGITVAETGHDASAVTALGRGQHVPLAKRRADAASGTILGNGKSSQRSGKRHFDLAEFDQPTKGTEGVGDDFADRFLALRRREVAKGESSRSLNGRQQFFKSPFPTAGKFTRRLLGNRNHETTSSKETAPVGAVVFKRNTPPRNARSRTTYRRRPDQRAVASPTKKARPSLHRVDGRAGNQTD